MSKSKTTQSPFDKETLTYFKELLHKKRDEAEEEVERLQRLLVNLTDADDADFSSITHHMGDVATDTQEEELNYQLLDRTRRYIQQIDDALERIQNGTYGICVATGKPISKARLDAVPHTRYSIEAKNKGLAHD
jgi:RNA polymerase-binding protein DksA